MKQTIHLRPILAAAAAIAAAAAVSCQKDQQEDIIRTPNVAVVDGHLEFSSQDVFDLFIKQVREDGGIVATKSVGAGFSYDLEGFTSIEDRIEAACTKTKASTAVELTEEEYAAFQAQLLLLSKELGFVMDSDLVITVGQTIYKITPYGTFSTPKSNGLAALEKSVKRFDPGLCEMMSVNDQCRIDSKTTFLKTFSSDAGTNDNLVAMPSLDTKAGNNFQTGYNITTYSWRAGFTDLLDYIYGKTETVSKTIDSKHRVFAKIYNVNYGFYQNAGFAIAVQEMCQFLFFNYWKDISNNKGVIGINLLDGHFRTYASSYPYDTYNPQNYIDAYSRAGSVTVNYQAANFVYRTKSNLPLVQGFGEGDSTFSFPKMKFNTNSVDASDRKKTNDMYGMSYTALTGALQTIARYSGDTKKPAAIILPYSTNNKVNNTRFLMSGLREYKGASYYNEVDFIRQNGWFFGIKITNNKSTVTFNCKTNALGEYIIDGIDIFGSQYYKGKWYGIRFNSYKK